MKFVCPDETSTMSLGGELASKWQPGDVIFLHGDLGAGKTTLVRGALRGLGFEGFVKSPSYTLIETYQIQGLSISHIDLYRISEAADCENFGLSDYLTSNSILLIEWPEKGEKFLPAPTWRIEIEPDATRRVVICHRLNHR